MITGVVLVRLQSGKEKQAVSKLREIKGVSHCTAVFGRWDLVVDIEVPNVNLVASVVVNQMRAVPGVISTETLITTAI